jgi:hypothetical protein
MEVHDLPGSIPRERRYLNTAALFISWEESDASPLDMSSASHKYNELNSPELLSRNQLKLTFDDDGVVCAIDATCDRTAQQSDGE